MTKTRTTVLGLGQMGSALARCLAGHGVPLSVWNRSAAKAAAFADDAEVMSSAAHACRQSELVIMCVADYAAVHAVLDTPDVIAALAGTTLVQLTSGAPEDARRSERWAASHGIGYLDAAILNYPSGVGDEGTMLFYAGDKALYDRHESVLRLLGGQTRYVGSAIGAATTLDCALLDFYYTSSTAMLHAAALCEAEDYPLEDFFESLGQLTPLLGLTADIAGRMIRDNNYQGSQCAASVHLGAMRNVETASRDAGIAMELPQAIMKAFGRPVSTGDGDAELPVVFKGQLTPLP